MAVQDVQRVRHTQVVFSPAPPEALHTGVRSQAGPPQMFGPVHPHGDQRPSQQATHSFRPLPPGGRAPQRLPNARLKLDHALLTARRQRGQRGRQAFLHHAACQPLVLFQRLQQLRLRAHHETLSPLPAWP